MDFFALNPIATWFEISSPLEISTPLASTLAPTKAAATSFPISSTPKESVPDLNSFTASACPSSANKVASFS